MNVIIANDNFLSHSSNQGNMYLITPTNKDLIHHGRLGQKWGERNGPPYPLGMNKRQYSLIQRIGKRISKQDDANNERSNLKEQRRINREIKKENKRIAKQNKKLKKAEVEKLKTEKNKQKAIEGNSYAKLYAIKDKLSYAELQNAMNRIDLEQRLYSRAYPRKKGIMDQIDSMVRNVDRVRGWTDKGIKAYNTVCTMYNHQEAVRSGKVEKWVPFDTGKDKKKSNN